MPFAQCAPFPAMLAHPWVLLPERARAGSQRLLLAFLIVTVQTLCVPLALGTSLPRADQMLMKWDAQWYGGIVQYGYRSSIPADVEPSSLSRAQIEANTNIAFFPAYPLLVRILRALTGMPVAAAMLLVSRIAAVCAWAYILALLARFRVAVSWQAAAVAAVALHPGAFFQVMPYSESLFMTGMLGFVYWTLEYRKPGASILAIFHGVLMTATKLIALPIVLLPVVIALWRRFAYKDRQTSFCLSAWDAAYAACGGLGFLLYCQIRFSHWDIYIWRQRLGWGIHPDYLFFLHWPPRILIPDVATGSLLFASHISRMTTAAAGCFLLAVAATDIVRALRRSNVDWLPRIALYWCAGWVLYVTGASFAPMGFEAMVRHTFPVHAALVLLAVPVVMRVRMSSSLRAVSELALVPLFLGAVLLQGLLIYRYANWMWVA